MEPFGMKLRFGTFIIEDNWLVGKVTIFTDNEGKFMYLYNQDSWNALFMSVLQDLCIKLEELEKK